MLLTANQMRLLDKYEALSPTPKHAFNVLAAAFGPLGETVVGALLHSPEWRRMTGEQVTNYKRVIDELKNAQLIRKKRLTSIEGWQAASEIREVVCRRLVADGSFARCCEIVETKLKMPAPDAAGDLTFVEAWRAVYFARKALYLRDEAGLLMTARFRSAADWRPLFVAEALLNPCDISLFDDLPAPVRVSRDSIAAIRRGRAESISTPMAYCPRRNCGATPGSGQRIRKAVSLRASSICLAMSSAASYRPRPSYEPSVHT